MALLLSSSSLAACSSRPVEPSWCKQRYLSLSGRVVDQARLLSPQQAARLTARLADLEAQTHHQFVVATTDSLQELPIESYSLCLARHWRIGQERVNDGMMLLVAPNERKVRIEIGTGLEGQLTDPEAKTIIDTTMTPAFVERRYADGIDAGVVAIAAEIGGPPLSKAQK